MSQFKKALKILSIGRHNTPRAEALLRKVWKLAGRVHSKKTRRKISEGVKRAGTNRKKQKTLSSQDFAKFLVDEE